MKRWLCMGLALLFLLLAGCQAGPVRPVTGPAATGPSRTGASLRTAGSKTAERSVDSATVSTTNTATDTKAKTTASRSTAATTTAAATRSTTAISAVPGVSGEKRAVWVSYYEIDALLKGKSVTQAGQAIDSLMKTCKSYGLNTIYFHVRGNSDAYYKSTVYPLAASVKALVEKGFDPLARAVQAAHQYGMELHAWINPYRVGKDESRKQVDKTFAYQKTYYYIPHEAAVQKLVVDGVKEVVEKYAVDGVQFDDYFYPVGAVPDTQPAAFEKTAYAAYKKEAGGKALSVSDWRRDAVDALIRAVYKTVHTRSGCVFGISPTHDAKKNREKMYADTAAWMNQTGMVDYMCPQVYFGFDHETAPFHEVVNTWRGYPRKASVKLYIGLALYKAGQEDTYAGTGADEWQTHDSIMARSVNWLRTRKGCDGFAFFSYRYFTPAQCGLKGDALKIAEKEVKQVLALMR